ncbi:hypothetical protein C0J52_14662 [Blattella germanica]|nr:hypothetical protein C0J52_14662 [Blattella germanica]
MHGFDCQVCPVCEISTEGDTLDWSMIHKYLRMLGIQNNLILSCVSFCSTESDMRSFLLIEFQFVLFCALYESIEVGL